MLLLFAGNDYYPRGGWEDFVKAVVSLDELAIREERKTVKIPARSGGLVITTAGEERIEYPAREHADIARHMSVTDDGTEYDWWHVVDAETMKVVASSDERQE